ncbi:hypothetical protein [Nocardiopsis sp. FIRDI 009]|uniref:hypothetical protein n=1 Tax=Nocardiopsis sp. FIRDI 009 TaxID=714197 RepID=UPI0018E50666|nr:hypothetical protein [Nocardiopsis sp. FIRDI 009]
MAVLESVQPHPAGLTGIHLDTDPSWEAIHGSVSLGWTSTGAHEAAIARLPGHAWEQALNPDGTVREQVRVAELGGLNTRPGCPEGPRLVVRRVRPSGRDAKKLTEPEKRTGWVLAASIAVDLDAWTRLLGCCDKDAFASCWDRLQAISAPT